MPARVFCIVRQQAKTKYTFQKQCFLNGNGGSEINITRQINKREHNIDGEIAFDVKKIETS